MLPCRRGGGQFARAAPGALYELSQETLGDLLEPVVPEPARLLEDPLDVRPQTRLAPAEARRLFGGEHFAHARALEQRERCRRVVPRVVAGREAVVERGAEIRGIVAEEGAGHVSKLRPAGGYLRLRTNAANASRCGVTSSVGPNIWKNSVPRGVSAMAATSDWPDFAVDASPAPMPRA